MSQDLIRWIAFFAVFPIRKHSAQLRSDYPEWKGGDWAMEILRITDEPILNTNEWAHYLHTLGDEYDEYPDLRTTKKEPFTADDRDLRNDPPDWYPLAPNEDPYLAVIYRKDKGPNGYYKALFPNEPDPGKSHIIPGTACGGALLTPRHVLTSCGCLQTFLLRHHGIQVPIPPGSSTHDIYDDEERKLTEIYVTHAVTDFVPDFMHTIETDKKKWTSFGTLNCGIKLREMKRNIRNWDEGKTAASIDAEPVVAPFSPDIRPDFFRFFPKWPPMEINLKTDRSFKQNVSVISIGMGLSKPGKLEFFSSISASITSLRHCKASSFVCNNTRVIQGQIHTCFCPLKAGTQKLTRGVIGWPIVQNGRLVGITASPRHYTDGTVLATIVHGTMTKRIEEYVTKKLLEDQNTPPPQYRARDLKRKFLIYNYDISEPKGHPFSRANNFIPKSPTLLVIFIKLVFFA